MTKPTQPASSEITPQNLYLRRRELMRDVLYGGLTAAAVGGGLVGLVGGGGRPRKLTPDKPAPARALAVSTRRDDSDGQRDPLTPYEDITTYNNYYELGLDKSDPAENAGSLRLSPWTVRIEGEVHKPLSVDVDSLLTRFALEERIYRMRCVEAWSMVIPWLGFPLGELLKQVEPTSRAKYVAFTTLHDPQQLPGQRRSVLDWPYVEGLRIDEAMHPLTLLAVGLYGKTLLGQNGAPLRLVVPWKYGFKGIKSIVKIELTEQRPKCTWNEAAPGEYGFYANVNPEVDHPRWSQRTERRIGELSRRITLPYNGYGEQVASLYSGLDLRRNF